MGGDSSGISGVGLFAELGARPVGSRAIGAGGHHGQLRIRRRRRRVRAAVDRGAGREVLFPRGRGRRCSCGWPRRWSRVAATGQRSPSSARRIGNGDGYDAALARANVETFRDTVEKLKLAREQALRGLEALVGRYPPPTSRSPRNSRKRAGSGAGRPAVGAARAPPDVVAAERRVAARVLRRPGSEGGAAAAHLAHGVGQRHLERPVRAQGPRQPGLERGREPAAAGLQRRGAADAGPDPHGGAEAGACRIRSHRRARLRRSRGCACRPSSPRRGARPCSARAVAENQRRSSSASMRYKVGSGDLRAVSQQQLAVFGTAVGAAARADRAARAARQPVPGPGRRIRCGAGAQPVAQAKE